MSVSRPVRVHAWLLLAICAGMSGAASALAAEPLSLQQQVVILNEGLKAFDQGVATRQSNPTEAARAFHESVSKFQLLVDSGVVNGRLYYNLGNACLEGGQIGKAILNYRRADTLIPNDGRLAANLRYARSLRRNQIAESGEQAFLRTLFFWHYGWPLRMRAMLGLGFYVGFWLLLSAAMFYPRIRWRYAAAPCLLLWLTLAASVSASWLGGSARREGVLLGNDVIVRKGNGEGFEPQFKETLHEGIEFVVLESRLDWLDIQLPDGKNGWIRTREAELISGP